MPHERLDHHGLLKFVEAPSTDHKMGESKHHHAKNPHSNKSNTEVVRYKMELV